MTLWLHQAPLAAGAARNAAVLAAVADGADVTILLDENVVFAPGGLDRFIAFVLQQEVAGIVLACSGEPPAGAAGCVAIGPAAYNWLGAFDENIASAELGLADYLLRARAAFIPVATDPAPLLRSADNEDASSASAAERAYFMSKWGGLPGRTTLSRPFASLGSRIDWSARTAPYGEAHDLERPPTPTPTLLVSRAQGSAAPPEQLTSGPAHQAALRSSIRAVYQALLERDPEDGVYAWYAEKLASGATTLRQFCDVVRASDEHRALLASRQAHARSDSDEPPPD